MAFNPVIFWGLLAFYGLVLYKLSPTSHTQDGFFSGVATDGKQVSQWSLTASVFISWIFAKSVTNAANLGASYGIVGGLAYATYWLSIPLAGWIIYSIRRSTGAKSLPAFLVMKYGKVAAFCFALAILIRLFNEVWSNTAVVGGYFGQPGSSSYIAAALVFTAITLAYSLKGGMRSAIVTDLIQAGVFVIFLAAVITVLFSIEQPSKLLSQGEFKLSSGMDLLFVAGLQIFSYPFHDPVLTDRGFINHEKKMLKAFIIAGFAGFICIAIFSLIGVYAQIAQIETLGNAPAAVGRSLGIGAMFMITVIMLSSAGSTLDSTFASVSKSAAIDLPQLLNKSLSKPVPTAMIIMAVFALLGNLPMFVGTDILKATTISGTMIMGLAPVFLFYRLVQYSPLSFHFSFWPGLLIGLLLSVNLLPKSWAIGDGNYAMLLGANFYGVLICFAGFFVSLLLNRKSMLLKPQHQL